MIKHLFSIILILMALNVYSQSREDRIDAWFQKAVNLKEEGKYDSALVYYQRLVKKGERNGKVPYKHWMGICYYELGETEQAKRNFQWCIRKTLKSKKGFFLAAPYYALADLYLADHQYDSALYYMVLLRKNNLDAISCFWEAPSRDLKVAFRFAKSFKGFGKLDSAIHYLAYHVYEPPSRTYDKALHEEMVTCYLEILYGQYGEQETKDEFLRAISSLVCEKGMTNTFYGLKVSDAFYGEWCYLDFFDFRVRLLEQYDLGNTKISERNSYTPEKGIAYLKQTLVYKELIGD